MSSQQYFYVSLKGNMCRFINRRETSGQQRYCETSFKVLMTQGYRATRKRHIPFNQNIPRSPCYSFGRPQKNAPWSHVMVLKSKSLVIQVIQCSVNPVNTGNFCRFPLFGDFFDVPYEHIICLINVWLNKKIDVTDAIVDWMKLYESVGNIGKNEIGS